jgi:Alpha/beta hydrolase domain
MRDVIAAVLLSALLLITARAYADVDRIEVLERTVLADGKSFGNVGPYERLRGRLYFAVKAAAAENQAIADIRLAPRDSQGRVTFAADFILLKPLDPDRGNGRLLVEPANRGDFTLVSELNDAPANNLPLTAADAGNGFLMEQGYALLGLGWSWDVPLGAGRLRADLPVASDGGKAIFGRAVGEISVTQQSAFARQVAVGSIGLEPASLDDGSDVLTVRESAFGARTPIAGNRWHFGYEAGGHTIFDPSVITLEGGFKPGLIYTVTYTVRGPRVAGLGLAAIRDALEFFRHDKTDHTGAPNPLTANGGDLPKAVIAFGSTQSARVLQSMVFYGLAADGRSRMSFDAALINAAGAGRGNFNSRFAQSARAFSPDLDLDFAGDSFPFATAAQTDPVTSSTGSVLDRASPAGGVPKLFYINSATEYWAHGASLTHTAADGSADLAPDPRARIYMIAGGAQSLTPAPERGPLANCRDPLDYRPVLRAMLLHLDAWATLKKEPPPSMLPQLADGSLGHLAQYLEKFPKIPGQRSPTRTLEIPRLDFGARFANDGIAEIVPPKVGKTFTVLVPLADADGLDKGGIRLPAITVPLGTYVGWNMQNVATGAPERLAGADGSFLPFETDENERLAGGDPRASIKERYPTRDAYTKAYAAATLAMAEKELILGSDVNPMIERAGAFYDRMVARAPADESCAYLGK